MRTFRVSDEIYEQLKSFVVDPFDDTPEAVIGRLIEIVNKAKDRWSPFDVCDDAEEGKTPTSSRRKSQPSEEEEPIVVL